MKRHTIGLACAATGYMAVASMLGCTRVGAEALTAVEVEGAVGDTEVLAESDGETFPEVGPDVASNELGETRDAAEVADGEAADDEKSGDTREDLASDDSLEPAETSTSICRGTSCAGFEDDDAGAAPAGWAVVSPNCSGSGKLVVDGDEAHSGTKSLRIDGGGGYCDHVFAQTTALPNGPLWLRYWVRFGQALGDHHVTFLAMRDAADRNKDLRQGGQSRILMWNRESDDATLPELSPTGIAASRAPVPGVWTCLEAHLDPATGRLETYVDGELVSGLVIDGDPTPDVDRQWLQSRPAWKPAPTDLRLGWESYSGQAMTLWFDDIALADARLGCAP